jgi:hypothetical protein
MNRSLLRIRFAALSICCLTFVAASTGSFAADPQTTLAISIRTLSSPYQVMYKDGSEAYSLLALDAQTDRGQDPGLTSCTAARREAANKRGFRFGRPRKLASGSG